MNQQKRTEILQRLRANNPNPQTELHFNSPFELLVAVTLSAQATDVSVNKATAKLFPVANTPQALWDLGVDGLKGYIKTIGLYNSKAENIIKACRLLLDRHLGEVPENREALEALPGVGRKTANVILGSSVGEAAIVVDTHVKRVANRLGLTQSQDPNKIEEDLQRLLPKAQWTIGAQRLLLHGRYVCLARTPNCPHCVLFSDCEWEGKRKPT